jgi:hypothetical protein
VKRTDPFFPFYTGTENKAWRIKMIGPYEMGGWRYRGLCGNYRPKPFQPRLLEITVTAWNGVSSHCRSLGQGLVQARQVLYHKTTSSALSERIYLFILFIGSTGI